MWHKNALDVGTCDHHHHHEPRLRYRNRASPHLPTHWKSLCVFTKHLTISTTRFTMSNVRYEKFDSTKHTRIVDLVHPLAHGRFGLAANPLTKSYGSKQYLRAWQSQPKWGKVGWIHSTFRQTPSRWIWQKIWKLWQTLWNPHRTPPPLQEQRCTIMTMTKLISSGWKKVDEIQKLC